MRIVIQKVRSASLYIQDKRHAQISKGLVVLVAISSSDSLRQVDEIVKKILGAKFFEGQNGHFEKSLNTTPFELLLVSQFTLYGSLDQQLEFNFAEASKPSVAKKIYNSMVDLLQNHLEDRLKTGIFGTYMNIILDNDGPVTFVFDENEGDHQIY